MKTPATLNAVHHMKTSEMSTNEPNAKDENEIQVYERGKARTIFEGARQE